MADEERAKFMAELLHRYHERRGYAVHNISHWKELCGRLTQYYGSRLPENLTEHALDMGVLAS